MTNSIKLIVFDWDGTLANSTKLIIDCIQQAALDADLPQPAVAQTSHIIGLGLMEAITTLFGDIPHEKRAILARQYAHYYHAREDDVPLFEGVATTLPWLVEQGVQLAVATGKGRRGLNHALHNSGLQSYFSATRTVDECHSKPHPQMLLEIMDEMGVLPEQSIMVGDTIFDLQMAKNAGVAGLGVTYGAHPADKLRNIDALAYCDGFEQVAAWIKLRV